MQRGMPKSAHRQKELYIKFIKDAIIKTKFAYRNKNKLIWITAEEYYYMYVV